MKNPNLNKEAAIALAQAVMDEGRRVEVELIHANGEAYQVVVTLGNHVYIKDVWDIIGMRDRNIVITLRNNKIVLSIR